MCSCRPKSSCCDDQCYCDDSYCGDSDDGFVRRFQTKVEIIAELEDYLGELKTEMQAVEEHLEDLRK
ncbi:MAG: hypothetical protein JW841_16475 [Deltaproteobacteria bacterium]|nr:hypothetical protein [Deltaproteobacteria bacterium]